MKLFRLLTVSACLMVSFSAFAAEGPVCKLLIIGKYHYLDYLWTHDKVAAAQTPQDCVDAARAMIGKSVEIPAAEYPGGLKSYPTVLVHYKFRDGETKAKGWVKNGTIAAPAPLPDDDSDEF